VNLIKYFEQILVGAVHFCILVWHRGDGHRSCWNMSMDNKR